MDRIISPSITRLSPPTTGVFANGMIALFKIAFCACQSGASRG